MLLFSTLALALEVDVHVVPQQGRAASLTFLGLRPGVEDTAEVPCADARSCRIAVTVTPDGADWLVAVRVEELRRTWLGGFNATLLSQPTFRVPTDTLAELFVGGEEPLKTAHGSAFRLDGLRIQARVRAPAAASR